MLTRCALLAFIFLTTTTMTYANECVILLHGLARSASSMEKMAESLQNNYFSVINYDYPSTHFPIDVLATEHIPKALSLCGKAKRIHFVTHSMGGILVRQYLSTEKIENLGRVVMLAPPNQGSEVVDALANFPPFQWLNGPAGKQLGTDDRSVPNQLGTANFELGIIAGNRTFNPILSTLLPNPDDGKVSVERTKLNGMKEHITLPVTHTFIMRNGEVIQNTITFLKEGRFLEPTINEK
ncbi:alpha/beta hydrolase [Vibrio sp. Of7-15]|uniref:esterase/lipase family protein n=1 Tax=Vibrio sp. Of7-15 TaxID=2724879 RepID=UPI001EF16A4F|nr:alpha/beta hydrolase [Vibrio sp. Of7-15]MCG7498339.1 alpha/beta hydrolase [Vibrio sp. Of7-15]